MKQSLYRVPFVFIAIGCDNILFISVIYRHLIVILFSRHLIGEYDIT